MSGEYTQNILRVVVAKICQTIGWHSIQTTPLDIMTDILRRYLTELTKTTSNYAVQFGRTQPNLDELGLAFRDMHINIIDLEEYIRYVESTAVADVPIYPVKKDSHLNFLKPGSNEVVTRPVHIYEHLPPMLPDVEVSDESKPLSKEEEPAQNTDPHPVFKRPADISANELLVTKRPRLIMEEEGRPTREISSVMMTTSGFLSPAREGKLPESRTPINTLDMSPAPMIPGNNFNNESRFDRKIPKVVKDFKKVDKRKEKANKELFKPMMDEMAPKKITTMKDVVRLKALKANVANNNANNNLNLPPDVATKPIGIKTSPVAKPNKIQPKAIKQEKPNVPLPLPKVPVMPDKFVEGKLSSEPDKSKLNIFKKISKVKDEKVEKIKIKDEPRGEGISQESRESSPDLIIDETDNKNWDQKLNAIKQEIPIKQEPIEKPVKVVPSVDVNNKIYDVKNSPHSEKDFLYDDDLSPPGTPSTPKTPEMPSQSPPLKVDKELKRKRKDKTKIKNKAKLPKYSMSPRRNKNDSFDGELDRPKTPNDPINLVKDEPAILPSHPPVQPPVFPFFTGYIPGPGLIPNPFFPRIPLATGMPKHGFGQPAHIPPTMPALPPFIPPLKPPEEIQEKPSTPVEHEQIINKPEKIETAVPKEKHKKEKKDKPKKKNKKDKIKNKSEKRKLKEEKKDKDKIKKEKKEKKKEKEVSVIYRENEGSVPKLTLKINSPRPPTPDVQVARKIMIKPVVKKEEEPAPSVSVSNSEPQEKREPSPELARISALITRPPKLKASTATVNDISPRHSGAPNDSPTISPTSIHKLKKSMFRAIPKIKNRDFKRAGEPEDDVSDSHMQYDMQTQNILPIPTPVAPAAFYLDNDGNKVWICPGCGGQDDGSPMIGCDDCDAWYHWVCVGIQVPPDDNEDWYCRICIVKKQETLQMDKKKKRKKKEKKEH